jgi:hypothetical protein
MHNASMTSSSDDILVSIDYPHGTAAVGWDGLHGMLWLTGSAHRGPGTGLEGYDTAIEGVLDEHTVQGGRLVPGAIGCEVVDHTGKRIPAKSANGAWIVVVDYDADEPLPVRFFDNSGRTVARPAPKDWERRAVDDATEPCPACGGISWSELTGVSEAYRAAGIPEEDWEPSRMVVCDTCGNRWSMGAFISFREDDSPPSEESQREAREMLEHRERAVAEGLAGLTFPIYRAVGFDSYLLQWGGHGGDTLSDISVGDAHWEDKQWTPSTIEVRTGLRDRTFESSEESVARDALQSHLFDATQGWPNRSEAGLSVWLEQEERKRQSRAAAARLEGRTLPIDDEPQRWTVATDGDSWVAVRREEKVTVTVSGRGVPIDSVELEEVPDPSALSPPPRPEAWR